MAVTENSFNWQLKSGENVWDQQQMKLLNDKGEVDRDTM